MPKKQVLSQTQRTQFWAMAPKRALESLDTTASGLTNREAKKRLKQYGPNQIHSRRRASAWRIMLEQFKSPLIIILMVAGTLTLFLEDWINAGVIFATVLVNTALGFWQENKAETILENLKSYVVVRARVKREGREHDIDAGELVPGDVIRITQGDRVPADGRILLENNLEVDEAVLTGESLPVIKSPSLVSTQSPIPDQTSMVMSGTLVVQGYADVLVTETGSRTQFGRIAELVAGREQEATPLQKAVKRFALQASIVLGILTVVLFIAGYALGQDPLNMFFIAVAVAVSAVPEGLPIALTVILAIGVERLAKKKGVVRKLLAAESLGSTNLILTDKTGTLTKSDMEVVDVFGQDPKENETTFLMDAVLNADIVIENPQASPDRWNMIGRSMEASLVRYAGKHEVNLASLLKKGKILDRLPFNSSYKYSGVIFTRNGKHIMTLLGAPELLLEMTTLSPKEKRMLAKKIDQRAEAGERLLGLISREVEGTHFPKQLPQEGFRYRGSIAFRDPLRPGVKEAIQKIWDTGVRTVIVTGDHKGTAAHIAHDLGLMHKDSLLLTGQDISELSDRDLTKLLPRVAVFARTTPEQKLRLARLYQQLGHIVAVTGDGVNDAPALQAADVGVAVGAGTDVAKSAADLIILDNNFLTIVTAIEEGRRILSNIKKTLVYLLSDSVDELALIGGALLFAVPIPLNALQILFVNFFSDSFPAIAFAFETHASDEHAPANKARANGPNIIDGEMRTLIFGIGMGSSALVFGLYYLLLKLGFEADFVRTFTFAIFSTYTLFSAFALRSLRQSIFTYNPFSNWYLTGGVGIGIFLTLLAIYLPFLQTILSTVALPLSWLASVFVLGLTNIVLIELVKFLYRKHQAWFA